MTDLLAKKFLDVIPQAMRVIRTEMRLAAKADLTVAQFRVLALISTHKTVTSADLCEIMGNSAPSMCRMVRYLVKRDLIVTRRDPGDRRQVFLELTPAGRQKFNGIKSKAQLRFRAGFEKLPPSSIEALQHSLGVIEEIFGTVRLPKCTHQSQHQEKR